MTFYLEFTDVYQRSLHTHAVMAGNVRSVLCKFGVPLTEEQERLMWESVMHDHAMWALELKELDGRDVPAVRVDVSAALRQQVFERDEFTCLKCGVTEAPLHADHVLPVFHGGETVLGNLQTLCAACNMSKGVDAVRYVSG